MQSCSAHAAGRKVVGVTANWSNPYVDAAPRIAARERLLQQVAAHDTDRFNALADAWHVTHAVGMGQGECAAMAGVAPAPFPAPLAAQPLSVLDPLRDRITCLCAQGGHAGFPQVNLPGATVDGLPVGLSIIGPRGSDATLVAVAKALEAES